MDVPEEKSKSGSRSKDFHSMQDWDDNSKFDQTNNANESQGQGPTGGGTNRLEVESAKQYKKNKSKEDSLAEKSSPNHNSRPNASSTINETNEPLSVINPGTPNMGSKPPPNCLPKLALKAAKYKPMPYTFRVKTAADESLAKRPAKAPPFVIQLDNTIAVVWSLFAKSPVAKPIGLAQLHWAHSFLQTIVNRHGEHPKDIQVCINAITDQIIELYAELNSTTKLGLPEKFNLNKAFQDETAGEANKTNLNVSKRNKSPNMQEEWSESFIDKYIKALPYPFSLNYSDLMNSLQKSTTNHISPTTTKSGKSLTDTPSKEELCNFLLSWKQDQIDKIQSEMQRLQSIEKFIVNCDKTNFPNLDKELHVLLAERNK